ncbi:MAG: hypothetical protein Q7S40_16375 [Opitutaceae bacterium]|nr:hypothetical protein [Opitutaceae bacterium]
MRSLSLYGFGMFFVLAGAALFALSLRKPKPLPPTAKKSAVREEAALQAESKKLRIAAGVTAGIGVLLLLIAIS